MSSHPIRNNEFISLQCSSDHFENCSPGTAILPRVLYKLTVCVNPLKKIVPEAVVITGLDNFLLQDEDVFNAKKARLLSTFLENLQQPVCLVAHNGNCFDFPLLARTLNEINTVSLAIFHSRTFKQYNLHSQMIDVHCVDSLPIFRKMEADAKNLQSFLDSELEELLKEEEAEADAERQSESMAEPTPFRVEQERRSPSPDLFGEHIEDDLLTQITQQAEEKYFEVSTPVAKKIRMVSPPRVQRKPPATRIDRTNLKPRQLFKPSYKLTSIFERFFGSVPPHAHRAEEDTLILLKCAQFHAKDFLLNIPNTARDLKSFVKERGT